MRKRSSFDSQLKSHDLSREDLNFFISTFVQSRFPYNIKLDENSGWLMRTFYGKRAALDDYAIVRHLTGKHWVASFPGPYTKYLSLDLDFSKDLKATLDAVLFIFPQSLVIQSSMSGGIHLYYFFDSRIGVAKLQKLVNKILNNYGIAVRPGYCEIFPQLNRALRLPLGKGSYLLDEETLTPLHQNVADGIRLIRERIVYHSISEILSHCKVGRKLTPSVPSPYEGSVIPSDGIDNSMITHNSGTPIPPSDKLRGKEFNDFIHQALRSGVQVPGTRYFLQSKLIYHCWSLGLSKEQCHELVSTWYFFRNHQSKDWKKNPARVLRNLKSAIECLYRNAELKGRKPRARTRKLLTTEDVRNITELTRDYRTQKFIFSLMQYVLNLKDSQGVFFRLPRIVITTFDCCSGRSYQEKMRFCESAGLIRKVREYYRQEHRARTYTINYSFSEGGEPVNSLEQGLKRIFDRKDLRLRYSKWVYYSKILKEG